MGQPHRQFVIAAGPPTVVAGVGLDEQIEQRARPVEPGLFPLEHPAFAETIGGDDHRWRESRADVVDPGTQLIARQPAVAVEHGGGELTGVDRHVGTVVIASQSLQLGGDSVDEGVDILGEDPCHARHRTRPAAVRNRWVFS